jgi:hypothetical protein
VRYRLPNGRASEVPLLRRSDDFLIQAGRFTETGRVDVANPKHSEHFDDLVSIPVLTDVIVPGRSPMPQFTEAYDGIDTTVAPAAERPLLQPVTEVRLPEPASTELEARAGVDDRPVPQAIVQAQAVQAQAPVQAPVQAQYAAQAAHAADLSEFAEPVKPIESRASAQSVLPDERRDSLSPAQPLEQAALTERDADQIAERLRARFAGYLREEGRRVIEARCREALEEHTSWLVRQVTREVALALEGEVMGWVRDAVREELAAHQASSSR